MRVLVADDEREVASVLASLVGACGHEVVATVTSGGIDVLHLYERYKPDVVLMDILMPRFNGLTICRALLSKKPAPRVILVSGKVGSDYAAVSDVGASAFLSKPISLDSLRRALSQAAIADPVAA